MALSLQTGWNIIEHLRLLECGAIVKHLIYDEAGQTGIDIERITSHQPGFGTSSMREIMQEYLTRNYKAGVRTKATKSSHLFHLYMGMIPIDRSINLVQTRFGDEGLDVIKNLAEIQDEFRTGKCSISTINTLKNMIYCARNNQINSVQAQTITQEDILACQDELIEFSKKTSSYISAQFIPSILESLERDPKKRQPDTTGLRSVDMKMSDEGRARWKEAIDNAKQFVPFKNLEHLRSYMSSEQLERLNRILIAREKHC